MNYQNTIKKIGRTYFKLAVAWGREASAPEYKAEAVRRMDAVKNGKKMPTKRAKDEAAAEILEVARTVHFRRRQESWLRQGRAEMRPSTRSLGKFESRFRFFGNGMIPVIDTAPPKERMEKRVKHLVIRWLRGSAPDYSGETSHVCMIGDKPTARTSTDRGDQYSRRCTYRKTDAVHAITVRPDYFKRVILRGIRRVDGMLTLDAEPIEHRNRTVYKAVWVRVRGKRLAVEKGYIAFGENGSAHARTASGAVGILTRRENETRFARHETRIREDLRKMRLNGCGAVTVTFEDSIAAGNCRSGTEHFRDKHFPNRDRATIEEILAVGEQRELAINACLRAIRRVKAAQV